LAAKGCRGALALIEAPNSKLQHPNKFQSPTSNRYVAARNRFGACTHLTNGAVMLGGAKLLWSFHWKDRSKIDLRFFASLRMTLRDGEHTLELST
jgi:hypothetical protein